MNNEITMKSTLTIVDRKTLIIDGVDNVLGFDSEYVTLSSNLGRVCVEGEELKIESLTKEAGNIVITGKISGVFYNDPKTSNVFKGLFK